MTLRQCTLIIAPGSGGAASALAKGGTLARSAAGVLTAYDAAGNAVGVATGVNNVIQNGQLTLADGAQIVGGALELAANAKAFKQLSQLPAGTPAPVNALEEVCDNGGCFVARTLVHISPDLSDSNHGGHQLDFTVDSDRPSAGRINDTECAETETGIKTASIPTQLVPIESVSLGQRVPTKHPRREDYDFRFGEPDEVTWNRISLVAKKRTGAVVDVEILRPKRWIEANSLVAGGNYKLYSEELEVNGEATVISITSCPALSNAEGEVITGRFVTREVNETVEITLESGESLEGTPVHPIWSPKHGDWVPMRDCGAGDSVLTRHGIETIRAVEIRSLPVPVYNIEVHGEHVYEVTSSGILVHNATPCNVDPGNAPNIGTQSIFKAPQPGKGQKLLNDGFHPEDFPFGGPYADGKAYFAKERALAEQYSGYGEGILEVEIPKSVYDARIRQYEVPYLSDPKFVEIPIPPSEFDVLNNAIRRLHD